MRTKRVLSMLLAVVMAIGAFGVAGVHAEEQEVVFGPGSPGWNGVVIIAEDPDPNACRPDEAVIVWEAFLGFANRKPSDPDSFISLYNFDTTHTKANVKWEAWKVMSNTDTSTVKPIDIKPSQPTAVNTSNAYLDIVNSTDKTDVKLFIRQAVSEKWYNWVRVQLTVTVPGTTWPTVTSAPIYVELRNPEPLAKLLLEANAELAKTDRHTKEYLDYLRNITRAAEARVDKKISQAELDDWYNAVSKALKGQDPAGTQVVKVYTVNSWGWDAFNKIFPDKFCKVWWAIKDVFKPILNFIGQIGRALGFLVGLFSGMGGLFKK